jgi:hypothetical protein
MKVILRFKNSILISLTIALFVFSPELSGQSRTSKPFPQLLFPEFSNGIIKMKSGKTTTANLNYNTVEEEMLVEQNGGFFLINNLNDVDTITLQNRKFVHIGTAFYEVIVKGHVSLYIQYKSHYAPVGSKSAYGLTSQTTGPTAVSTVRGGNQVRSLDMPENTTVESDIIYWAKIGDVMNKFTSERQFIKIFPGNEDKIKAYIKSSKLDLKSPEGLLMIGKFCNELLK